MIERARAVFIAVYHARECADLDAVKEEDLFPEVAQSLRELIRKGRDKGMTYEFQQYVTDQ